MVHGLKCFACEKEVVDRINNIMQLISVYSPSWQRWGPLKGFDGGRINTLSDGAALMIYLPLL